MNDLCPSKEIHTFPNIPTPPNIQHLSSCYQTRIASHRVMLHSLVHHLKAEAGTSSGLFGTKVAHETCGQVSPAKLRKTVCIY